MNEGMNMSEHYYTAAPASAHDERRRSVRALGVTMEFITDAGVFSRLYEHVETLDVSGGYRVFTARDSRPLIIFGNDPKT